MTDLEKLLALLDSWKVPVTMTAEGSTTLVSVHGPGWYGPLREPLDTTDGYPGFYTQFEFKDGAFIKMGAWE